ncbi:MAG: hypothetical protein WKI04_13305 [Ferruginibacter sp.]
MTILVELPIIALFFKRKKRSAALIMAFLINIISWAAAHIIFFSTDFNMNYVAVILAIGEAIAFRRFLECNWKKAIIMSLIVNILSFTAVRFIPIDSLLSKPGIPRTTYNNAYQTRY